MLHEYSISIGTSKLRANERNVDRNKFIITLGERSGGTINLRARDEKFPIVLFVRNDSIRNIAMRYLVPFYLLFAFEAQG